MRRYLSRTRGVLSALLAGVAVLCCSATSFAASPALGPDCGAGAAIVGSDSAGKVTLGTPTSGTCTLAFSVAPLNPPACTATNETNGGGQAVAVGVRTTATTMEMDELTPWNAGDVISYMCTSY
jgi:hypothetical protein